MAFTISQALLLKSVVSYVQNDEKEQGHKQGLVLAAVFVFGGLAVSNNPVSS